MNKLRWWNQKQWVVGLMVSLGLGIGWLGYDMRSQMQQQHQAVEDQFVWGAHELNQLQREILRLNYQLSLLPTAQRDSLRLQIDLTQSRVTIIQKRIQAHRPLHRLTHQQSQEIEAILVTWSRIKPQLDQIYSQQRDPQAKATILAELNALEVSLNHMIRSGQDQEWNNYNLSLQRQKRLITYLTLLLSGFFLFAAILGFYALRFIEVRQRLLEELKQASTTDELTQIPNRRCFNQVFYREWNRMLREEQTIALILCDIDFFKQYNDYYGHQAGDQCLFHVAQALANTVRRSGEFVARYGGEEFVIVVSNRTLEEVQAVTTRLHQQIHQLAIAHAQSKIREFVTLSTGTAIGIPTRDLTPEMVLQSADQSLYQAKSQGRNQSCWQTFGGEVAAISSVAVEQHMPQETPLNYEVT
jgi:diguanylate cyclase (GGDEF)-like protein